MIAPEIELLHNPACQTHRRARQSESKSLRPRVVHVFIGAFLCLPLCRAGLLTILPSLKEGDSYRTQRVPRWVPAAGPIRAGLTSQAIRASPALGYSTDLVFQSKNLVVVPAKTA
jgi:hypothetical protein